jgi:excinuclease UvrABC nuclease subunit
MEIVEQGINEMKPKLLNLLNSKERNFEIKYDDLKTEGIYAIYEGDEIIYIGQSKNFQDRLYNHLLKQNNHDLADRLVGYKNLEKGEPVLNFLLKKCRFKVIKENYRLRLEHFAVGVLKPKFNKLE